MNFPQVRLFLPTITIISLSLSQPRSFPMTFFSPSSQGQPSSSCSVETELKTQGTFTWSGFGKNEISSWLLEPHWDDFFPSIVLNCINFTVLDGWETIRFILWKKLSVNLFQWNLFQWNYISCIHIPFILLFRTIVASRVKANCEWLWNLCLVAFREIVFIPSRIQVFSPKSGSYKLFSPRQGSEIHCVTCVSSQTNQCWLVFKWCFE